MAMYTMQDAICVVKLPNMLLIGSKTLKYNAMYVLLFQNETS